MNEKIGMYSIDEIYETLTENVEGSFLNRSMVDAMIFKIKELQQENKQLKEENRKLINNKYDAIYLIKDLASYDEDTHTYCDDINYYDVQKIIDELKEGVKDVNITN